jgi:hypothetical protein
MHIKKGLIMEQPPKRQRVFKRPGADYFVLEDGRSLSTGTCWSNSSDNSQWYLDEFIYDFLSIKKPFSANSYSKTLVVLTRASLTTEHKKKFYLKLPVFMLSFRCLF